MYDAAIVGCGVIGTRLAEAFAEHDRTTVGAACDVVADRAGSFAAEYDCEAYTDHREVVDDVDLVYVGVPPAHHRAVVTDALSAGTPVLCEKPLAEDAAAGAEMVAAAADADVPTAVNLPFRYTDGFRALVDDVASGAVGDPKRVELAFRFPRWPREWQDVDWLRTREQGGPLREVGTHFLFGVQELFGPVESVSARVDYVGPDLCETSVAGHLTAGGVDGVVDLLTGTDGPEENTITVVGTEGTRSLVEWYRLLADRHTDDERVLVDDRRDTTLALVDEFVAALDGDDADLVSFAEANAVQRVVDAVFASEGELVRLEH
jgi:predicted dehydrogenase